jgi:hypothetical protein
MSSVSKSMKSVAFAHQNDATELTFNEHRLPKKCPDNFPKNVHTLLYICSPKERGRLIRTLVERYHKHLKTVHIRGAPENLFGDSFFFERVDLSKLCELSWMNGAQVGDLFLLRLLSNPTTKSLKRLTIDAALDADQLGPAWRDNGISECPKDWPESAPSLEVVSLINTTMAFFPRTFWPNLRSLQVHFDYYMNFPMALLYQKNSPMLEEVDLDIPEVTTTLTKDFAQQIGRLQTVRIRIVGGVEIPEKTCLNSIEFWNLELDITAYRNIEAFLKTVKKACPKLKVLHLGYTGFPHKPITAKQFQHLVEMEVSQHEDLKEHFEVIFQETMVQLGLDYLSRYTFPAKDEDQEFFQSFQKISSKPCALVI